MVQTDDQQRVTEANVAFYDALTNRDLAAMERLWFPADWVECVHPGMPRLRGWEAVHESWAVLFATAAALMVAPTAVQVRLVGDVAWVGCEERIANWNEGKMLSSMAHATNVFVRHDDQWRMYIPASANASEAAVREATRVDPSACRISMNTSILERGYCSNMFLSSYGGHNDVCAGYRHVDWLN